MRRRLLGLRLAALAATAVHAATNVMVPLYVYPGNSTWTNPAWSAAVSAVAAHPSLHYYLVLNPNSGPQNTSDPTGHNGGYCNVADDPNYIPHGCNRDWTTHLRALNRHANAQTLGYVYTGYGARPLADVQADIREWAAWDTAPTWTAGQTAEIGVHGLWLDEIGADSANYSYYHDLVAYANETFHNNNNNQKRKRSSSSSSNKDAAYTVVLNAGPVANATYEAQLFGLASAVVTKETCYTDDPAASGVAWDCPAPYTPFAVANLTAGNGLPHDDALLPQTVVIVHQFTGPPAATLPILQTQLDALVRLGVHSTYFTSGSWHNTTIEPATIGQVGEILNTANGNGAGGRSRAGWAWPLWIPWTASWLLLLLLFVL